ncbi:MAG: hypothetical protein M3Y71_11415 [Actinomycetota bacterium]|nr:hypothetical protein [Actinomycetota bacterium]
MAPVGTARGHALTPEHPDGARRRRRWPIPVLVLVVLLVLVGLVALRRLLANGARRSLVAQGRSSRG